jgi:hypothetical protein
MPKAARWAGFASKSFGAVNVLHIVQFGDP